jgi:serine/threonine protein kinase
MLNYFLLFIYFDYIALADFGVSKITKTADLQSSTINVIGTPSYIAPEVWSAKKFVIFFIFILNYYYLLLAIRQNQTYGHWECYYII